MSWDKFNDWMKVRDFNAIEKERVMKSEFQMNQVTRKFIRETKLGKALTVYTKPNTDLIVWEPKEAALFNNWFKSIHKQTMYNGMMKKTKEIINSVMLNNIDRDNIMIRLNGGY